MKDHLEAVVHIPKIIQPNFLKRIIPFIESKAKIKLKVGKEHLLLENARKVHGYQLNDLTPSNFFYFNFIKHEIERLLLHYKGKFPLLVNKKIDQIDLLKYKPGGKYDVHLDDTTDSPRSLSVIMNLNDDYVGGDLIFTDQKYNEIKSFKLTKGSIVFFPSNFMYPHGIKPITKGKRYSIVAWLR
jgi:predicted 2-oxoglutarate/Fe(II)-dependent dioxygenase YbiX|tara:strand:- start:980 stop:1534 length:555 start_codon:yes stop_codon:yes gene_type:complete